MSTGLLPTLIRHLRRPTGANPPADAELVRRFAALRDGEAFEELLRRHGPLVWGVCRRRLPNRADAEDAFQSTFLVLARRAVAIRRPEALGCWLYGVAHRVAGRMRGRPVLAVPDELPSAAAPVAETATVREFLAALDEELLRLPEKLRGPLVLCFLQERTQDEAAKQLGVSLSTLKRRLDAGRELLRVRLSGRGVELSAALAAAGLAVPWSVADAAVRAAVDGVSAGVVSANVLTVTEGVVRAMTYTKLKAWSAGVLMATAAVGGTGYFAATGSGQTGGTVPAAQPTGRGDAPSRDRRVGAIRKQVEAIEKDIQAAGEALRAQEALSAAIQKLPKGRQEELLQSHALEARYRLHLEASKKELANARKELAEVEAGDTASADPPELRKLRQEKLKAAKAALAYVLVAWRQNQKASASEVHDWSKRVLEAEREANPSANQAKAAREHFDRMSQLERDQAERVRAGVADEQARAAATFYRLEAEVWVREAAVPRGRSPDGGAAAPTEVEKVRLTLEKELAKVNGELATQMQRAERLAVMVQKLTDELDQLRRGGADPPQPKENRAPAVPEGFKGTVRRIDGTASDLGAGREVWVEITPGTDAGLRQGAVLTVRRVTGVSGKYLGTITVVRANAKDAVGRFIPANPRKVGADDVPKSGDDLVPNN